MRLAALSCLGALGLAVACTGTRAPASAALEPRYVAVHNALAAMGLAQIGPLHEGALAQGQETRLSLELPAGCNTVVAVGGGGIRDVDVSVQDARGRPVAHDTTSEPQAVVRACVEAAGTYTLVVRAASGGGPWVAATWAGGVGEGAPAPAASAVTASQPTGTCESPIPLAAGTVSGTTRHGESNNTGSCDHSDAKEVVYELDVPQRQRVSIEVDARFDAVLYVRKDDCAEEADEVECNDDAPNGGRNVSRIQRVLEPGKYFVFVDGYNAESGPYKLTVSTSDVVALGDACQGARALVPGATVAASTEGRANDAEASCGGGAEGADVPWRFELGSRARVRLVERSDDVSPVLHVRRACDDALSEAACGESGVASNEAAVTGIFDPGGYTVFADARQRESAGSYALSLETARVEGGGAVGDGCGDAMALGGASGTVTGDTFTASDELAGTCGGAGAADVVYRIDVPRRGRLRASLGAEEGRHLLVAWHRCGERASELACGTSVDEVLEPGTYFLGVDGATPDALGRFALTWATLDLGPQTAACSAAPALVAKRTQVGTTAGGADHFATSCGAADAATGAPDRVYRFSLSTRSHVRIELEASRFDALLALRRSCADLAGTGAGAQITCAAETDRAHRTRLDATLEAGTYWVVVDGQTPNDQGSFVLQYSFSGAG
jgi:hypothetical protein